MGDSLTSVPVYRSESRFFYFPVMLSGTFLIRRFVVPCIVVTSRPVFQQKKSRHFNSINVNRHQQNYDSGSQQLVLVYQERPATAASCSLPITYRQPVHNIRYVPIPRPCLRTYILGSMTREYDVSRGSTFFAGFSELTHGRAKHESIQTGGKRLADGGHFTAAVWHTPEYMAYMHSRCYCWCCVLLVRAATGTTQ